MVRAFVECMEIKSNTSQVGSLLAWGIGHINGRLHPYQVRYIFYLEDIHLIPHLDYILVYRTAHHCTVSPRMVLYHYIPAPRTL